MMMKQHKNNKMFCQLDFVDVAEVEAEVEVVVVHDLDHEVMEDITDQIVKTQWIEIEIVKGKEKENVIETEIEIEIVIENVIGIVIDEIEVGDKIVNHQNTIKIGNIVVVVQVEAEVVLKILMTLNPTFAQIQHSFLDYIFLS